MEVIGTPEERRKWEQQSMVCLWSLLTFFASLWLFNAHYIKVSTATNPAEAFGYNMGSVGLPLWLLLWFASRLHRLQNGWWVVSCITTPWAISYLFLFRQHLPAFILSSGLTTLFAVLAYRRRPAEKVLYEQSTMPKT
jgi:hypothetical protein